jgi:transposase
MKQGFIQPLFIGIDVSKQTLDVSCLSAAGKHNYHQFDNTKSGLRIFNRWLSSLDGFSYCEALFCMEHTGIYTRQLIEFLLLQGGRVWLESALHLKRSMGMIRGK